MLDADDAAHGRCADYLKEISVQLVTTWPVVTEAMYLLGASWPAQQVLLQMIVVGDLRVEDILPEISRIEHLMEKYRDVPMDFADASLVVVAERKRWESIFTLDNDFRVYRIGGRLAFQIVP